MKQIIFCICITMELTACQPNLFSQGVSAESVPKTAIQIAWTPTSTDQDGFIVSQSSDNKTFDDVATVAGNVTTATLENLNSGQTYYIRVAAYNASGSSSWSQTFTTVAP